MKTIGYARVSTKTQTLDAQRHYLSEAGCDAIHGDICPGMGTEQAGRRLCLSQLNRGDTLLVTRIDRLGRVASDVIDVMYSLERKGVLLRSLHEEFDTSTEEGKLTVHILARQAERERIETAARARRGIDAAKARGAVFGNPAFRRGDQEAIASMKATQADTFLARARLRAAPWIDHVRRLRPERSWGDVHRYIEDRMPPEQTPPLGTMVATVRRLVRAGDLPEDIMKRSGPHSKVTGRPISNKEAGVIARRLHRAMPSLSLRALARKLEALGVTPARAATWSPGTIAKMLKEDAATPS